MSDILDEASALVQCKECPWYKACVTPMRINMEDVSGQLQRTLPMDDSSMHKLLSELAYATQNLLLESCPIFMKRLKANPKLAERIKKIMQDSTSE
ncbi:MAG: hypothetical protein NTV30_10815 [Chloroflexi bacterium]|nr:hypothetical protein [Chloroflexota bacterium]